MIQRLVQGLVVICLLCLGILPSAAQDDPPARRIITAVTANHLAPLRVPPPDRYRTDMAWSPDGRLLALVGRSNEILIYEVEADVVVQTISFEDGDGLEQIAFTPDGTRLVGLQKNDSETLNGVVWVWDAQSGERLRRQTLTISPGATFPLVINPSGGLVFIGGNLAGSQVVNLSTTTSTLLLLGDYAPPYPSISPDFEHVVFISQGYLYGYALTSGERTFTSEYFGVILPNAPNTLSEEIYTSLAISPDSSMVAVVAGVYSNADPDLTTYRFGHLYDLNTGNHLRGLEGTYRVMEQPTFNHDSSLVAASACPEMVKISDTSQGEYWECPTPGLQIWATKTGQQVGFIPYDIAPNQITRLLFSPDGRWLAVLGNAGLQIYGVIEPLDRTEFSQREINGCEVLSAESTRINQRAAPDPTAEIVGQLGPEEITHAVGQSIGTDGRLWWQLENEAWVRSDVVVEAGTCAALPNFTTAPPEVLVCNPDMPSRLIVGGRAQVTFTDGTALNLRDAPGGTVVMQMEEGTPSTVLAGPTCLNGAAWWQLQLSEATIGWASEGAEGVYYLEPQ